MKHKIETVNASGQSPRRHTVMYTYAQTHPFRAVSKDGSMRRDSQTRGFNLPMNSGMNFGGFRGRGGFNNRGGMNHNNGNMGNGGYRNNSFGGGPLGGGGFQGNPMGGGFQSPAAMGGMSNYGGFNNRGGNMMMGGMRGGGMRGRGVGPTPTMAPNMMGMPAINPMASMGMNPMAGGMNPMMGGLGASMIPGTFTSFYPMHI